MKNRPSWEWPADARTRLLGTLRDENSGETDRSLAVEIAGDLVVMNDEVAAG